MKTIVRTFLACVTAGLAACVLVVPPTTNNDSHAEDLAAIAAFNQQYLKAINEGDVTALSDLTDADHIMIPPNRAPIVGKDANDTANGKAFQQFKVDETWTPLETVVDGNLAYQRGLFTVSATPKSGGAARTTRGNFLRVYRRLPDGSWRMTRDMFSSDQPPDAR
jgi:ketosteroid isomerase-like protein